MEDAQSCAQNWLLKRNVCIVAGTMKGGTSSMRCWLKSMEAQDSLSLPWDEPHFFDDDWEWRQGAEWYKKWFDASCKFIGDVTPSYMDLPDAIKRMKDLVPHARIVVLLRNPIDRALSNHNHDIRKGPHRIAEIEDVNIQKRWEKEIKKFRAGKPPDLRDMFGRGLYAKQLAHLWTLFPRSQVHVIISERFRSQPEKYVQEMRDFFGLPQREILENVEEVHVGVYEVDLNSKERRRLRDLYAEDVAKLKRMLNDSIDEWLDFSSNSDELESSMHLRGSDH
eukprot:gnl/MRDRNA2_/MRDRNA2_84060_c0_seq1.p1 gnl/MRDRNA2_/MRDRNA2_84060_c0~~gnl/MRDRNA2_/MRDRNA2_84060_c0_seq1.p1  ORF type:complete len:280 (-),score=56.98 gnl/MRDRNA2_/MRDRNA2_84060_c0_seq1:5-844(-)